MIKKHAKNHSVGLMCRLLNVSKSGYYDWASRKPSKRNTENQELLDKITKIFDANKARTGAIRITDALKQSGEWVSRHRVARLMRLHSLRA